MAAPTSSLSSVVSKLTRASLGALVSPSVKDEDLDRYVAELIMKEAKQSEERYKGKDGIAAYLPHKGLCVFTSSLSCVLLLRFSGSVSISTDANVPKPNKRFLHQMIRNTDDHNTAVLQAQARAAEDVRAQREEAERAERRARAVEASQDRIRRLMGGASRRSLGREASRSSHSSRRRRSASRDHTDWRDRDDSEYDDRSYIQSSRKRRREDENDTYYSQSRTSRNHSSSRHASPTREEERPARHHSPEYASCVGRSGRRTPSPPMTHDLEVDGRIERGSTKDDTIRTENVARREKRRRSPGSSSSSCERPYHSERHRNRLESPLARSSERTPPRSESPGHSRDSDGEERRSRKSSRHPERDSKKRSKHGHRKREAEKKEKKHKISPKQDITEDDTRPAATPAHSSKMDKYFDPAYDPALDYTPVLDTNAIVQEGAFDSWNTMLQLIRVRKEDREAKKRREKDGLGSSSSSKRPTGAPDFTDIVYKKRGSVREWDLGKD